MQFPPVTNDASQSFATSLAGQLVEINLRYRAISQGWYITLRKNGQIIVASQRLNNQSILLRDLVVDFEGDIVVVPSTKPARELGRRPWGNTHKLVYLTADEVKAIL